MSNIDTELNVVSFNKPFEGHNIRFFKFIDDETYFVGKDSALALEYADTKAAINNNCKHAISIKNLLSGKNDTQETLVAPNEIKDLEALNLDPQTKVITKRDIFRLVMRSNKPEAEKFQDWVFDVIDEISKTGSYNLQNTNSITSQEFQNFKTEIKDELSNLVNELSLNNIPNRLFSLTECRNYLNYKYFNSHNPITIRKFKEYMQDYGILKSNFKPYVKYTNSNLDLELVILRNNRVFSTIKDDDIYLTKIGLECMIKQFKKYNIIK